MAKRNGNIYTICSLLLPSGVKGDVCKLYQFIQTATDFTNAVPPDSEGFHNFCSAYRRSLEGKGSGNRIIDDFAELSRRKNLEKDWIDIFLRSSESDLHKFEYETLGESLEYVYGSAEVLGLITARLIGLPADCNHYLQLLCRAVQYINLIRNIGKDNSIGRRYLPLEKTGLRSLERQHCLQNRDAYIIFLNTQKSLYMKWYDEAVNGYSLIPKRFRIIIKTAVDMHIWISDQISKDPFIVFSHRIEPSKKKILWQVLFNIITL